MRDRCIILNADELRREDFLSRKRSGHVSVLFDTPAADSEVDIIAYFLLQDLTPDRFLSYALKPDIPVFIDGLNYGLRDFTTTNPLAIINAWPGFLKNEFLEISFADDHHSAIERFLTDIGWKFTRVADQPGLAVPRVISMIVNEACYAVSEKVSTPLEIDTSMKIGTNYPYGPFEWSKQIGSQRIISLLKVLETEDERYRPAPGIFEILTQYQ